MIESGANGMPSYDCPKCKTSVVVPEDLPESIKAEAGRVARRTNPLQAMRLLVGRADVPLGQAKGIGLHLTRREGKCHRCGTILPGGEAAHCTQCGALNLNW